VVAVLLTQREIAQVPTPTLASTRPGVRVAQRRARIAKAKRRSRPLSRMVWARTKLPIKRKITGSA
jgi:hypothetical protein